jgi:flavin reductase (DIM6/NTAB) family NADH-FMN oxidoreductase RutF
VSNDGGHVSEAATPIEPDDELFRAVMGRFATGVSVMTSVFDGEPHGMTANAVASLSLDPLLVLVCVERGTVMERYVEDGGVFALSFLSADQSELSDAFADHDRPRGTAQFAGVRTSTAVTGSPLLAGSLGWVDCRVWSITDGGDHVVVVGEVMALSTGVSDDPLVYYRSRYGRFGTT